MENLLDDLERERRGASWRGRRAAVGSAALGLASVVGLILVWAVGPSGKSGRVDDVAGALERSAPDAASIAPRKALPVRRRAVALRRPAAKLASKTRGSRQQARPRADSGSLEREVVDAPAREDALKPFGE